MFPGNSRAGLRPNVQSVVTLFDAADGAPLAAIHGESFTRMKTAANSALAADLLARSPRRDARGHRRRRSGQDPCPIPSRRPPLDPPGSLVWNRTRSAAERLAAELREDGVDAEARAGPEEAVAEAAIVTCLTASPVPVLRGAWLKAGAHVDLVGGFTPAMRESDDDVVRRGRLFADTLRFTLEDCGDFADPISRGVIAREKIEGDLFDLARPHRRSAFPEEITVFKNGGGGHLDLMVARAIYDGTRIE